MAEPNVLFALGGDHLVQPVTSLHGTPLKWRARAVHLKCVLGPQGKVFISQIP